MTLGYFLLVTNPGDWTQNAHWVVSDTHCYSIAKSSNPAHLQWSMNGIDAPLERHIRERAESEGVPYLGSWDKTDRTFRYSNETKAAIGPYEKLSEEDKRSWPKQQERETIRRAVAVLQAHAKNLPGAA